MSRRRLRHTTVFTSSSEDEDEPSPQLLQSPSPNHPTPPQHPQVYEQDVVIEGATLEPLQDQEIQIPSPDLIRNIDSVTLNSSYTTTTTTTVTTTDVVTPTVSRPPVEISDEDFTDVPDNLFSSPVATDDFVGSDCLVNDQLRRMGVNLKREWLDSCKLGLQNTVPGFANFDAETKAKLCFGQFLYSDMNNCGAGVLPENVHQLHLVDLAGPYLLQVDEVVNISCPLRERYKNAPPGNKRCLKLSMTDGVQHVIGMEYKPIKSLEALAPSGFKVVIQNINVRRGILMLVPEVFAILGGSVEDLEAARQRLVHEVNKPPRGKRTRTGVVPSLSARATLAAWGQIGATKEAPTTHNVTQNHTNSVQHAAPQIRENAFGSGPIISTSQASQVGSITTEFPASRAHVQHSLHKEPAQSRGSRETTQTSVEAHVLPTNKGPAYLVLGREPIEHVSSQETAQSSVRIDDHEFPTTMEAPDHSPVYVNTVLNSASMNVAENEDAHMADHMEPFAENEDAHMADHMEPSFVLRGERELPFTYLASMFTKWDELQDMEPSIQGKIKCFLTGVKMFQFRGQPKFELRVYIDDGSLISEILVHHNVVQRAIGHSPEEIAAALSSSDSKVVAEMKNTVKQFQSFLINFEGVMLLEINEMSNTPVALEMHQGCPTSDAQLLFQRLKHVPSSPFIRNGQLDVITLSP